MIVSIFDRARSYAIVLHGDQRYGDYPYIHHIDEVTKMVKQYTSDQDDILAAILHDSIEDTDATYEGIAILYGNTAADIVRACSGFGKNRKERMAMILNNLKDYPRACLVKACDRLVNMQNSKQTNSGLFSMYVREHDAFLTTVWDHIPNSLYNELLWIE
jgi:(p)ppGpp synthase/HD superfamily hydrolase